MALTYRGDGAWGIGKGSNLTAPEFDGNTYTHFLAIQDLIDNPPEAVSIDDFLIVGSQLTITLTDATTRGPFTLPVARHRYRGAWAPATAYLDTDLVSVASLGFYFVLQDHTSAATFDEEASNSGGDFYRLFIPNIAPAPWLPVLGATYVPVLADANRMLRCAVGCTVILSSSIFQDGTEIHVMQDSASPVIFETDSGAVVKPPTGDDTRTAREGAVATAKWNATNSIWHILGDLAEVSA